MTDPIILPLNSPVFPLILPQGRKGAKNEFLPLVKTRGGIIRFRSPFSWEFFPCGNLDVWHAWARTCAGNRGLTEIEIRS